MFVSQVEFPVRDHFGVVICGLLYTVMLAVCTSCIRILDDHFFWGLHDWFPMFVKQKPDQFLFFLWRFPSYFYWWNPYQYHFHASTAQKSDYPTTFWLVKHRNLPWQNPSSLCNWAGWRFPVLPGQPVGPARCGWAEPFDPSFWSGGIWKVFGSTLQ